MRIWVFSPLRVKNGHFQENQGCRVKKGPFLGKIPEGLKITIFEKNPKWSKIIKNGLGHKNSAIKPRFQCYMPRSVSKPGF